VSKPNTSWRCGNCGSTDVTFMAWCEWDFQNQTWVTEDTPDFSDRPTFCFDCEMHDVRLNDECECVGAPGGAL